MTEGLSWCYNKVSIHGTPENIGEVVEFVRGQKEFDIGHRLNGEIVEGQLFSFHSVIPIKGDWSSAMALARWGVRSHDAIEVKMYYKGNFVVYEFLTPWCAPLPVCGELRSQFADVYISWFYDNPQELLCGYIRCNKKI
jgi:hypothetical protein